MTGSERLGARIVLVHGTWGRKSNWAFPGSVIWDRLEREFPGAEISRFEWSGYNRHVARYEAAVALELFVSGVASTTVLVGHSHGGNVVERVLLHTGNNIENDSRETPLGGITVGTPFLRFEPSYASPGSLTPVLDWVRFVAAFVGIALGAALLIGQYSFNLEQEFSAGEFVRNVPLNGFSKQLALTTLVGLFTVTVLILGLLLFISIALLQRAPVESAPISTVSATTARLTGIRTKRDEASMFLLVGRFLGHAVNVSRRLGLLIAGIPAFVGFGAVAVIIDAKEDLGWTNAIQQATYFVDGFIGDLTGSSNSAQIATITFAAMIVLAVLGLLAAAIAVVEAIVCGSDGVPLLRRGRVRTVGNPHGDREQVVIKLTSHRLALRHSRLMSDPASIDAIVDACRGWLNE